MRRGCLYVTCSECSRSRVESSQASVCVGRWLVFRDGNGITADMATEESEWTQYDVPHTPVATRTRMSTVFLSLSLTLSFFRVRVVHPILSLPLPLLS